MIDRCTRLSAVAFVTLLALPGAALGQACPTGPVVVSNTMCTETPGTTITVTPANAVGLNASGTLGQIVANSITDNLAAATTTGALAQSGAQILFNDSTLQTTATATAASAGQTGLRATGPGSNISSTNSLIRLGPANGTTTANNLVGATADNGASLALFATTVQMLGGTGGASNFGLVANGAGSSIMATGTSVSTISRGSFGVLAQNGGAVTLGNGTQVTTTGAQNGTVGSHALYASGAGSRIGATGVTVSTSGTSANAARAENGATIDFAFSQFTTTGNTGHALLATGAGSRITGTSLAISTNPVSGGGSAARADNGGEIALVSSQLTTAGAAGTATNQTAGLWAIDGGSVGISGAGSSITTTGRFGHGASAQGTGSSASVADTAIDVSGLSSNGVQATGGGGVAVTDSSIVNSSTSATFGVLASDAGSSVTLFRASRLDGIRTADQYPPRFDEL
jgi:autotransporter family porin